MNELDSPKGKRNSSALGMYIMAWLIILALLYYLADHSINHHTKINSKVTTLSDERVMRIEANSRHQYNLPCIINRVKLDCLVDTGATYVSIPEDIAMRARLKRGVEMLASTANGDVKVYATIIKNLTIGIFTLHDIRASINPAMHDQALLGMSALKHLDWHIEEGALYLGLPKDNKGSSSNV